MLSLSLLFSFVKKRDFVLPVILAGIGAAGIVDEGWGFLFGEEAFRQNYWGLGNLVIILLFGALPTLILKAVIRKAPRFKFSIRGKHLNPKLPKITVVVPAYNEAKFISIVDWRVNNYKEDKQEFFGISWKDFFPFFDM